MILYWVSYRYCSLNEQAIDSPTPYISPWTFCSLANYIVFDPTNQRGLHLEAAYALLLVFWNLSSEVIVFHHCLQRRANDKSSKLYSYHYIPIFHIKLKFSLFHYTFGSLEHHRHGLCLTFCLEEAFVTKHTTNTGPD